MYSHYDKDSYRSTCRGLCNDNIYGYICMHREELHIFLLNKLNHQLYKAAYIYIIIPQMFVIIK